MANKILTIAAHPDDELLGLGGTIRKRVNNGDQADCLILGEGLTSRENNRDQVSKESLEELYSDTYQAAEYIGYDNLYFSKLPDNRFDSVDLLDIIKEIEKVIKKVQPDIIYTHHYGDLNIDHQRTFEAVITACRPVGEYRVKEIYAFETPSSTEWNFQYGDNTFKPNLFVDISETIEAKLKGMDCYDSEKRDYPHPRSLKALKTIAARWGTVVGKEYVEAFELIRKVED
ncbi:PIG-L deacetylase family protein [Halanaerobium sp.]|uniref:PIG-L deacetylase family protein n=1 Tax=Halanaerobium sp. TaxID=1895664 RepID=UPI000DE60AEC|nr:PIG-L deacetylase family protein [Halanaerobium sp.]PUU87597.1 MAG: LmbE family protein [Halanaerobium sp.]